MSNATSCWATVDMNRAILNAGSRQMGSPNSSAGGSTSQAISRSFKSVTVNDVVRQPKHIIIATHQVRF